MIQLLKIRVQYLNGDNIIKTVRLPARKHFTTMQAMEDFRKLRELKLQFKADQRKQDIKISVNFDYKEML